MDRLNALKMAGELKMLVDLESFISELKEEVMSGMTCFADFEELKEEWESLEESGNYKKQLAFLFSILSKLEG